MVLNPKVTAHTIFPHTTLGQVTPINPIAKATVFTLSSKIEKPPDPLAGLDLSKCKLDHEQKEHLKSFLASYSDIFAVDNTDLGCFPGIEHEINTGNHAPIHQKPYRIPVSQRAEVKAQFADMLKAGVIEPSNSPWSSPLVIVPKKDGTMRMCVDFRKLNAVTEKMCTPYPLLMTFWINWLVLNISQISIFNLDIGN